MSNKIAHLGWSKKSKGCAKIYRHPDIEHAIVDRRGFGINSALGLSITYKGIGYGSVEEAAEIAMKDFNDVEKPLGRENF